MRKRPPGFEPGIVALQATALPLGDGRVNVTIMCAYITVTNDPGGI